MDMQRQNTLQKFLNQLKINTYENESIIPLVDQALTHVSSGKKENHEPLEFLGDAVIRLASTEYIDKFHPELTVGQRSSLRAQLVSDRWLAQLGHEYKLKPLLILGQKANCDTAASSTLLADTTEALIGAVYKATNSMQSIHAWLTPHWQKTADAVLRCPEMYEGKSALQEWSQARGLGLPQYITKEINQKHGDPHRFQSLVIIAENVEEKGLGRSRKEAEQAAATAALRHLNLIELAEK
tara:strand:- start:2465 stop:3184 length:720 start_codon:yes stop_codon:yes gene_type:complete